MNTNTKYVKYLEEIGFKKATKFDIEKYVVNEFNYIYDALWYIYNGSLNLEELKMDNLPLIITGDLNISNSIITEDYNGLVVLGKTTAESLYIDGNTYLEDVRFSKILVTSGNGAPRIVKRAEGPFIYHSSDSVVFYDVSKVQYYLNTEDTDSIVNFIESVEDYTKYLYSFNDWSFTTKEEFDKDEHAEEQYDTFENYLAYEVGIDVDKVKKAIENNTLKFKKN